MASELNLQQDEGGSVTLERKDKPWTLHIGCSTWTYTMFPANLLILMVLLLPQIPSGHQGGPPPPPLQPGLAQSIQNLLLTPAGPADPPHAPPRCPRTPVPAGPVPLPLPAVPPSPGPAVLLP
ncbi:hypothetical protein SKAU_G00090260 [Synaphobranchus kaupii]|uniref:Uncharacterized protein n=1 Tax=Synaphobranchus kaupii TaxID=118154 RepID=A0A9Q1FXD1_SYNKA|nr:hypothetical protein SKAU_G00090260 [Synaphobranchus kaupii]